MNRPVRVAVGAAILLLVAPAALPTAAGQPAGVLVITIDTLRADRMSAYGYERPTTPNLDALIADGVRFDNARTIEPLTSPALCSMMTSLPPHEHGASRNGLRMRTGLPSLPKTLQGRGYRTAAFVGNWTLRDKLSGLAEHFERYDEVLTRRRWLGLVRSEATAADLTSATGDWLAAHVAREPERPFFAWVHYVEPHAPYRAHDEVLGDLGLERAEGPSDRYDSEIAFVDRSIGRLLERLDDLGLRSRTLIVFASDHGESLGEHGYWGHGRNLYEPGLRIPMSITFPGRVRPGVIAADSVNLDLAPTVMSLLGFRVPPDFHGVDWTPVIDGGDEPSDRITEYQAHRGAVISRHDSDLARRAGLLAVARLRGGVKEIFDTDGDRAVYRLDVDPGEAAGDAGDPSESVQAFMRRVYEGLASADSQPPEPLDDESIDALRSLGYVD